MFRQYQKKSIDELKNGFKKHRKLLLWLATGAGKTFIFCRITKQAVKKGNRVIIVVRGRKLVSQASNRLTHESVEHGVLMSGHRKYAPKLPVQVCSIDTLIARDLRPEADLIIIDECFTQDTEILTEHGFIKFKNITKKELVAQFNENTEKISFCKPTRYIEKYFSGTILKAEDEKNVCIHATADHEILINRHGNPTKIKFKDVKFNYGNKLYKAGKASGTDRYLSPEEKLMIMLQADGSIHSRNTIYFTYSKYRKIKEFKNLMAEGAFEYREISGREAYRNVKRKRRFSVKCKSGLSKKIHKYFKLKDLSYDKCKKIIEYMVLWDGSVVSDKMYYYSSTCKDAVDFYQSVACLAGHSARITVQIDNRSKNYNDIYRLFIRLNTSLADTQQTKVIQKKYSGKVYCVTVKDRNIITRNNGKISILGNCHLSVSKGYKTFLDQYPKTYILSVTATPWVHCGLRHVADEIIHPITIEELTTQGYLSPFRAFAPSTPDLSGVSISSSTKDYVNNQLFKKVVSNSLMGNIVEHWEKIAKDRPTLCFAVNIKHSKILVERFLLAGIAAEHMDANSNDRKRNEIIKRIESGETKIICNVGVLSLGVDIPCIGAIIMARPTQSRNLFIQQCGRGTRIFPGKKDCILLDHSGNISRHGFPTEEPEVSLDGRRQSETVVKKSKICKQCFCVYRGKACPECGTVPEVKKTPLPNESEGVLVELEPVSKVFHDLKKEARRTGKKPGWVYHQMVNRFGLGASRPYLPFWFIKIKKQEEMFSDSPYRGINRP